MPPLLAAPLVLGEQLRRHVCDDRLAGAAPTGLARVDVGQRGVAPLRDRDQLTCGLGEGALRRAHVHARAPRAAPSPRAPRPPARPAGGRGSPARAAGRPPAWRPRRSSRGSSGRGRRGPGRPRCRARGGGCRGPGRPPWSPPPPARPSPHARPPRPRQLGVLGQVAATVGEPGQLGVDVGEIQQASLDGGVGLHCGVLSVGWSDRWAASDRRSTDPCGVSRRGPRRYRPAPPAGRRPPARTTATPTPSARRPRVPASADPSAGEQVLRRRMVPQVRGDVGVDARRDGRAQRRVARAPADRHAPHRPLRVARGAHAPRRRAAARRRRARRTRAGVPARAACRSGRARASTAGRRARGRRTRVPRRGAPPAARRRRRRGAPAAAPSPACVSATRSSSPDLADRRVRAVNGLNWPVPAVANEQWL